MSTEAFVLGQDASSIGDALAKGRDAERIAILAAEARPGAAYLDRLEQDLAHAESASGAGNAIVYARAIPNMPAPPLVAWCARNGIRCIGDKPQSLNWQAPVQALQRTASFIARPSTFDFGAPDGRYSAAGTEAEIALRALLAGKTLWTSTTALVGQRQVSLALPPTDTQACASKWGSVLLEQWRTGILPLRLSQWKRSGPLDVADLFWLVGGVGAQSVLDVAAPGAPITAVQYWSKLSRVDKYAAGATNPPAGWTALSADPDTLLDRVGMKAVDVVQVAGALDSLSKETAKYTLRDIERAAKKLVLLSTSTLTYDELEAMGYATARHIEAYTGTPCVAWKINP